MRPWIAPFAAGALVVALLATTAAAVVASRRASTEQERTAALAERVDELEDRTRELEAELAELRAADPLRSLLEGLAGRSLPELFGGGIEGMLDELLGGGGDGLQGLLDGLLGGDGGILGSLAGVGDVPGARCLLPGGDGTEDGLAGIGDLLGGLLGPSPAPEEPEDLVRTIATEVAELRALPWSEQVQVDLLDDRAVRSRLGELLDEAIALDRDRLSRDEAALTALRAIPPGTDLAQLHRELLEDSVAGFYVTDAGELVVRVPDDGRVRGVDRITIAHELGHALVDQAIGLPDRRAPAFRDDADADLGVLAVIEGDATLLMHRWALAHVPLTEQLSALGDPDMVAAQAALDRTPHHLQRELLYPYTDGLDWACERWLEGGWAAIDAAYADPPTTSYEVRYGERVDPAAPATPTAPDGYVEVGTTTFGAAPLAWLFEAPGGDTTRALDDPDARAAAWGGGTVTVFADGGDTAVALALVDAGRDTTDGLCSSVAAWFSAAAPDARALTVAGTRVWREPGRASALHCDGPDVVFATAPELPTALAVAAG